MTLLVRDVGKNAEDWHRFYAAYEPGMPVPLWAFLSFVPSEKDNGTPSFYEVENEGEIDRVAGSMLAGGQFSTRHIYAYVRTELVWQAGFTVEHSPGETTDPVVDEQHRHVALANAEDVMKIASVFLLGDTQKYVKNMAQEQASNSAKFERLDFVRFAGKSPATAGANMLSWIKAGAVKVHGNGVSRMADRA